MEATSYGMTNYQPPLLLAVCKTVERKEDQSAVYSKYLVSTVHAVKSVCCTIVSLSTLVYKVCVVSSESSFTFTSSSPHPPTRFSPFINLLSPSNDIVTLPFLLSLHRFPTSIASSSRLHPSFSAGNSSASARACRFSYLTASFSLRRPLTVFFSLRKFQFSAT